MTHRCSSLLSLVLVATANAQPGALTNSKVSFSREVAPIISSKCYHCHGQDEDSRKAELRLDLREEAIKEHDGVRAIVPGKPEQSALVERILSKDKDDVMPPPKEGHAITPAEAAILRKWIAQGAEYEGHWAFRAPVRPEIPVLQPQEKARNPIDHFIAAGLRPAGLAQAPEADRHTLLRRVSLDLLGLPPSPAEIAAFEADPSPEGFERAVDRLLASPHFGEKWARPWLDLARYADSTGYGSDKLRLNIWPYRDWVINALNANRPYDEFSTDQIAGDLIPNATREQRVATAFHRNTMTQNEGGTDDEEYRVAAVKDRVATTVQGWMGLTAGCAQCHSHKFDPISHKEYYQLFAIFNQTEDADRPDDSPLLPLPTPEQTRKSAELQAEITAMEAESRKPSPEIDAKQLEGKRAELAANKPVEIPVMKETPGMRKSFIFNKGNYLTPAEEVQPGLPGAFHPGGDGPVDRLALARWIFSQKNPLTSRVAVNRFWSQIFGMGLVETEEDFGTQGTWPSHPELLDWLAIQFQSPKAEGGLGWDIKALLKLMVTSHTYRQNSLLTPQGQQKDPRNVLLSRYTRRRLEAEAIRDQALTVSGLLGKRIGGPSVYPPQPDGLWTIAFRGVEEYPTSTGEDRWRRSLYTIWRRIAPNPTMATFDAPTRENCTLRRVPTNTPLQAFVTLNDPVYFEAAQGLARRILREPPGSTEDRLRYGLTLVLQRPPTATQLDALRKLVESELAHYGGNIEAAKRLSSSAPLPLPPDANAAELAAWTAVANVLLNLDGFLTKS